MSSFGETLAAAETPLLSAIGKALLSAQSASSVLGSVVRRAKVLPFNAEFMKSNNTASCEEDEPSATSTVRFIQARFETCQLKHLVLAPFVTLRDNKRLARKCAKRNEWLELESVACAAFEMAKLLGVDSPESTLQSLWAMEVSVSMVEQCADKERLFELMWHNERVFEEVDEGVMLMKQQSKVWWW